MKVFTKIISISMLLIFVISIMSLSSDVFAQGNNDVVSEHFTDSFDLNIVPTDSPMLGFMPLVNVSTFDTQVSAPDSEIDFGYFNESPHKGNIYNGIPYEYIGHTEQHLSEIFKTLIGTDFDDSNLETKRQYVDTPQRAAQIVAVLYEYEQKYDRFFYAVSLDEELNCWVVEYRYYNSLRPDGANTSFFLVNRNDAKIVLIDYTWYLYCRDCGSENLDEEGIPGNPPTFIFGLSDWAVDEVSSLKSRNLITHTLLYRFQEPIRRDEFTTLIMDVYEYIMGLVPIYSSPFTDIQEDLIEYTTSIEKAKTVGLIDGTSTTEVTPKGVLTREQTAKILCNMVTIVEGISPKPNGLPDYIDATAISGWATDYVAFAQEQKIMLGNSNGQFNPKDNLSREEALVVVERLIVQYGW